MLNEAKLQDLTYRVQSADHHSLSTRAAALLEAIRAGLRSPNSALIRLDAEREARWKNWPRDQPNATGLMHVWEFPSPTSLCPSLAWDLFNTVAERGSNKSMPFLHELYRKKTYDENTQRFLTDWFDYFRDAINQVIEADSPPSASGRQKHEKFGILDSPSLFSIDMKSSPGALGRAVLYIDIDGFKAVNTQFTESTVDRVVLPAFQQELEVCARGNAFAYQEGGDEYVMLLPNASQAMAKALAESVCARVRMLDFDSPATDLALSVSIGVAHETSSAPEEDLRQRANEAKNLAKGNGKNQVAVWPVPNASKSKLADVDFNLLRVIVTQGSMGIPSSAEAIAEQLNMDHNVVWQRLMEMRNRGLIYMDDDPPSDTFCLERPAWKLLKVVRAV